MKNSSTEGKGGGKWKIDGNMLSNSLYIKITNCRHKNEQTLSKYNNTSMNKDIYVLYILIYGSFRTSAGKEMFLCASKLDLNKKLVIGSLSLSL